MSRLRQSVPMWAVVPPDARSLSAATGIHWRGGKPETVGTYFVALYFKRKFAVEAAKQWKDARVVRARIAEAPNA